MPIAAEALLDVLIISRDVSRDLQPSRVRQVQWEPIKQNVAEKLLPMLMQKVLHILLQSIFACV